MVIVGRTFGDLTDIELKELCRLLLIPSANLYLLDIFDRKIGDGTRTYDWLRENLPEMIRFTKGRMDVYFEELKLLIREFPVLKEIPVKEIANLAFSDKSGCCITAGTVKFLIDEKVSLPSSSYSTPTFYYSPSYLAPAPVSSSYSTPAPYYSSSYLAPAPVSHQKPLLRCEEYCSQDPAPPARIAQSSLQPPAPSPVQTTKKEKILLDLTVGRVQDLAKILCIDEKIFNIFERTVGKSFENWFNMNCTTSIKLSGNNISIKSAWIRSMQGGCIVTLRKIRQNIIDSYEDPIPEGTMSLINKAFSD